MGVCGLPPCFLGLQLEYGTPKFTVGASSLILINSVFAQYNALSLSNDRFRTVVGLRGSHVIEVDYLTPGILGASMYVGPELHLRHLTLRTTVGGFIDEYGEIFPTLSAELLYNFRLK